MDNVMIQGKPRLQQGGAACKRLRRQGLVPCVVYGHGKDAVAFAADSHDLRMALRSGQHIFGLKVEGQEDDSVLVKEVQFDSLGDEVLHVDFMRIAMDEEIEVTVPIITTGQAKGVVNKGIMDLTLKEIELVGLPAAIPDEIRVAVNNLDINDSITVAGLALPEGLRTTASLEQVVVIIHPPAAEEERVAAGEETEAVEPEVIGARKAEEEEEEEEERKK